MRWEHFKYFFTQKCIKFLKSFTKIMKQNPECTSFKNNIQIEYRQNALCYTYISFALGLIANAKEGKCLVQYRLNLVYPRFCRRIIEPSLKQKFETVVIDDFKAVTVTRFLCIQSQCPCDQNQILQLERKVEIKVFTTIWQRENIVLRSLFSVFKHVERTQAVNIADLFLRAFSLSSVARKESVKYPWCVWRVIMSFISAGNHQRMVLLKDGILGGEKAYY